MRARVGIEGRGETRGVTQVLVSTTPSPNLSSPFGPRGPEGRGVRANPARLRGWPRVLLLSIAALLMLLMVLPLFAIAIRAAPTLGEALLQEDVGTTLQLTAWTSVIAVLVIIALGTPTAWLIARKQIRGWKILDAVLDLPVVLPPAVAGIGLLFAFGRRGLLGPVLSSLGIELAFSTAAVVIAQVFVAAPLYIRAAVIGLRRIDEDLESVAMVEGATTWQVFRFVTLPLSSSALITGAVLAWARALGEFGATILFAGNFVGRTQTMSLAIYINFQSDTNIALALALVLVIVSLAVLLLVRWLARSEE